MDLKHQRILLTGAGGGIGSQLVELLGQRGARLGLVNHGAIATHNLVQQVEQLNIDARVMEADITTDTQRLEVVQKMLQAYGGVDVLVNLAGAMDFSFFSDSRAEMIPKLLRLNLEAPMQLVHHVLPGMLERGSGQIVNIGSMFGSIGFPGFAAYSASKFGLRGFSQALRRELNGSGIGVTYVSPRGVRTAFNPAALHRMAEEGLMRMDDAQWVAGQIVAALEEQKNEAYLGFPESFFARVNGVLPGLVDRSLKKSLPVLATFARSPSSH
ncbi:SDR family oxidoreductase [Oleiagrimonas sp. C23AA]|uniref:SDR family oxidoreductase n=1 Tax=Oleiagrimonas sp. C23AA TaxID=2719047 RepID=UPI00142347AC|nr:SDR family oxidoreductase [Oleiagrimonas sp. C23AA]NII10564.1 SDR family oxidoreductase [Oleiagrimonas sp. C23AA]